MSTLEADPAKVETICSKLVDIAVEKGEYDWPLTDEGMTELAEQVAGGIGKALGVKTLSIYTRERLLLKLRVHAYKTEDSEAVWEWVVALDEQLNKVSRAPTPLSSKTPAKGGRAPRKTDPVSWVAFCEDYELEGRLVAGPYESHAEATDATSSLVYPAETEGWTVVPVYSHEQGINRKIMEALSL